jgi:hypothetical protein
VNLLWSAYMPYGGSNVVIAPARLSVEAHTIITETYLLGADPALNVGIA